jgi:hypothetical protein
MAWRKTASNALFSWAWLGLLALAMLAQTGGSALSGVVRDQNGDVIPDVQVKVLNLATSQTRETVTGRDGSFYVPVLPPGRYAVTLFHNGFAPLEITDIELGVGEERAFRVEMRVGGLREEVTVISNPTAAVRDDPALTTTLDQKFTSSLPLNGRSLQAVLTLTPGFVVAPGGAPGQFNVNGQRANANYFMVDGVSANVGNQSTQGIAGSLPPVSSLGGTQSLITADELEAVWLQTSTYSAQYGRQPGAQIAFVSRAGSNRFHGNAFGYHRPRRLEANSWFANRFDQPHAALHLNQFGGSLGGPFRAGKAFFFFAYEGQRANVPGREQLFYVPPANLRETAHPNTRPVLRAYPLPNLPQLRFPAGGNGDLQTDYEGYFRPSVEPFSTDAASLRLDYNLTNRFNLFARYHHAPSHIEQRRLSMLSQRDFRARTLTLGGNLVVEGRWTGDWRVNLSDVEARGDTIPDNFGGAVPLAQNLAFPQFAGPASYRSNIFLPAGAEALALGSDGSRKQRQLNAVANAGRIYQRHLLQAGFDYRRLSPSFAPAGFVGYNFTRFNNGTVFASARSFEPFTLIFHNFSAYLDETWRKSSRLTLSLGLRWELVTPPRANGVTPLLAAANAENPRLLDYAPAGAKLWQTRYGNFAPRFGVAYQLSQTPGRETVVRGAFGLFYDLGLGAVADLASTDVYTRQSFGGLSTPFPPSGNQLPPPNRSLNEPLAGAFFSPRLLLPYTAQWNATLQRALGAANNFTLAYVAAAGRRLLRPVTVEIPNERFQSVTLTDNSAFSSFHSLQTQFQRRLARGLQAFGSYTLAHSLDNASDDSAPLFPAGQPAANDKGSSDFDARHNVSAALSYDFPTLWKKRFISYLWRDWTLGAVCKAQSALPVNVRILRAINNYQYEFRPDTVNGAALYLNDRDAPGGRRLNPAAFTATPATRQGTLGRNVARGFGVWEADFALRRLFNLSEKVSLQFSAEVFNAFNRPNFNRPNYLLGAVSNGAFFPDQTFGQATGTFRNSLAVNGITPFFQIGGPRSMQFSARVNF